MDSQQEYAVYPLTLFDVMANGGDITVGWLVEGILDFNKTEAALTRLVAKWPMLGGRLELDNCSKLQLKIPLGPEPFPRGHLPFVLTSRTSVLPITDYIELPLPLLSDVLPVSLFTNNPPRRTKAWIADKLPLMHWHLTYFTKGEHQCTCLGITFPHGVFDGIGIAAVIHALEFETLGKQWPTPPPLSVGHNNNQLTELLNRTKKNIKQQHKILSSDYQATSVFGLWLLITFLFWHVWQEKWHQARSRLLRIPEKVYKRLVQDTRVSLMREGKTDVRVSTGDVLAVWIFKVIYSEEKNTQLSVNLSNMASLRMFADGSLDQYAHNCFIPISYPMFTVKQLQTTPVHSLAYELASARSTLSIDHALQVCNQLEECAEARKGPFNLFRAVVPFNSVAGENLTMTNVSIGRVVDINWRGLGGGRTLCRYKSLTNESHIRLSNFVTIAGRLDDGSTILDVVLNKRRLTLLEDELYKLTISN